MLLVSTAASCLQTTGDGASTTARSPSPVDPGLGGESCVHVTRMPMGCAWLAPGLLSDRANAPLTDTETVSFRTFRVCKLIIALSEDAGRWAVDGADIPICIVLRPWLPAPAPAETETEMKQPDRRKTDARTLTAPSKNTL